MKPEAQRIAIAEACGWINQGRAKRVPALLFRWAHPVTKKIVEDDCLPDYLNDLNAMNEAEKVLTEQQQATYALFLHRNSNRTKYDHLGRDFDVLHATAAQRAEAFLRTIGKWDADSPQ